MKKAGALGPGSLGMNAFVEPARSRIRRQRAGPPSRPIVVALQRTENRPPIGRARRGEVSSPARRSVLHGSPACGRACARVVSPRLFLVSISPMASHKTDDASSPERRLHAASSSSGRAAPVRHCCLGRALARFDPSGFEQTKVGRDAHRRRIKTNRHRKEFQRRSTQVHATAAQSRALRQSGTYPLGIAVIPTIKERRRSLSRAEVPSVLAIGASMSSIWGVPGSIASLFFHLIANWARAGLCACSIVGDILYLRHRVFGRTTWPCSASARLTNDLLPKSRT